MSAYRPDIDGLRALAIVPVLLFHAGLQLFGGGFVGVDVFFVISGYLITGILLDGRRSGPPVAQFYLRRIRRIVPALFVVAVCSCGAAWALLQPDQLIAFAGTLLLLPVFASNIRMWKQSGYFDPAAETVPLLHTWSLAVEEQFYAVFPLLVWLVRRYGGGRYVLWFGLIAAISLASSIWGVARSPSVAFYSAHTRAFELLAGALVAVGALPALRHRIPREIVSGVALLLILVPIFAYGKSTPFPGLAALPPTLGAALLIHAGSSGPTLVRQVLSSRPFVLIGLISYSLYLWHWPLLVFAQIASPLPPGLAAKGAILVLAAALATLTWWSVETPFRRKIFCPAPRQLLLAGAACGVSLGLFGFAVLAGNGLPQRIPAAIRAQVLANSAMRTQIAYPPACRRNFRHVFEGQENAVECPIGGIGPKTILFWGDSQIEQLYPLLSAMARDGVPADSRLIAITSGGCPPVPGLNSIAPGFDCAGFNQRAFLRAQKPDIDTVVFASAPYPAASLCQAGAGCQPFADTAGYEAHLAKAFAAQVRALADAHKKIIVILPFPSYPVAIPDYLNRMLALGQEPSLRLARAQHLAQTQGFAQAFRAAAEAAGAEIIDPSETLCLDGTCLYQRGHVALYSDASHLGPDAAKMLRDVLVQSLQAASGRGGR